MNPTGKGGKLIWLGAGVKTLARYTTEHYELLGEATANPSKVYPKDHVVIATLPRSLANIDGFLSMIEQGNKFCAIPITRSQLGSLMRVLACTPVDDTSAFGQHLLQGESPSKFKDRSGKQLRETYLKDKLAEKHEPVDEVYEYPSGYVHLSNHHLMAALNREQSRKGRTAFIFARGIVNSCG